MIVIWSEGPADDYMDEAILVELGRRVRRHPWWRARARLTIAILERAGVNPPARVLDAGCGWGVTLDALERRGYRVTGLDISRRVLDGLDRPDRELIVADLSQPLPGSVAPFDAVLALDVIEHLDDDRQALARLAQLTRPHGGIVVISVPAQPDLFSEFDEVQGHRRRYLPDTLRSAFEGTGLELESVFWWAPGSSPSCEGGGLAASPSLRNRRPGPTRGTCDCPPGRDRGSSAPGLLMSIRGRSGNDWARVPRCSRSRDVANLGERNPNLDLTFLQMRSPSSRNFPMSARSVDHEKKTNLPWWRMRIRAGFWHTARSDQDGPGRP